MSETETIDARYRGIDTWSDLQILDALYTGQARAISAVRPALPAIAAAAGAIAGRIEPNGRLIYAGAGSSGRQAALDGMELGSTFGWPVERLAFVLAEGVVLDPGGEDVGRGRRSPRQCRGEQPRARNIRLHDRHCRERHDTFHAGGRRGSHGLLVRSSSAWPTTRMRRSCRLADQRILLQTGAEIISGSTRMNAGTAQKAALGLLSTLLMTRLGHVHDGLMVSMLPDCSKLEGRAARIVAAIAGCTLEQAPRRCKHPAG